jgi:predicted Fe-Mo cluster-binding NifX family protein
VACPGPVSAEIIIPLLDARKETTSMKIAFPVQEDRGLESPVFGHFGSAPLFLLLDRENGDLEAADNPDHGHEHGQCQPMAAMGGRPVDVVIAGGMGAGALRKLQAGGIRVFRGIEGSVRENLELLESGRLPEFLPEMSCNGHAGQGGCHHL